MRVFLFLIVLVQSCAVFLALVMEHPTTGRTITITRTRTSTIAEPSPEML